MCSEFGKNGDDHKPYTGPIDGKMNQELMELLILIQVHQSLIIESYDTIVLKLIPVLLYHTRPPYNRNQVEGSKYSLLDCVNILKDMLRVQDSLPKYVYKV